MRTENAVEADGVEQPRTVKPVPDAIFPLDLVRAVSKQLDAANRDFKKALGERNVAGVRSALERGAVPSGWVEEELDRCIGPVGHRALHGLIVARQPELLQLLLNFGADPNELDEHFSASSSPLMLAVGCRQAWAIAPLLRAGANINLVGGGRTALSMALEGACFDAPEANEMLDVLMAQPDLDLRGIPCSKEGDEFRSYFFHVTNVHGVQVLLAKGLSPTVTVLENGRAHSAAGLCSHFKLVSCEPRPDPM